MTKDRHGSGLVPDRESVTGSFSPGVEFISSVIAGLLIGLALDSWLHTRPIFIIVFIIGGFVSGFYKLWHYSEILEKQAEERRRV